MEYLDQSARTALQRVKGMPFAWSLNPYRGCAHACLYCYARIYHTYLGYDDPADFDRVILRKADLPTTLRRELLARHRPVAGEIAIGTATDPYQPLEAREGLTRRCLEVLLEAGRSVSITTKSPLALRDLDLFAQFAAYGGVRVNVTVTVLGEDLWRLLEPQTPKPLARLDAVRALVLAGIPTSVFLAPVVPALGERDALRVLEAASQRGASHVMVQPLRLSPGVREWLLPRLLSSRPAAAAALGRLYGDAQEMRASDRARVLRPILARRAALGLDRAPTPLRAREDQLSLFAPQSALRTTALHPNA